MLSAPFFLIAGVYDVLPAELPVLRVPISGVATIAPKSVFTAFRVPLMNLTHALMAAVMLSRASRRLLPRTAGDQRRKDEVA
jgi:uncharacterized membrane protein